MLQSMGLQRIGHDLETENQQQPSLLFPINSLSFLLNIFLAISIATDYEGYLIPY